MDVNKRLKLRSDWRAFGVNYLFLFGMHAAKWVQHPLKNETHTSNLRLMARQSEQGFILLFYLALFLDVHLYLFLAHLIDFCQMCYCCRKLDFHDKMWEAVCQRVRKWEAVLPSLDKTDQIRSQSQSESTASHGLPLLDALAHGLPHFVMRSV